MINKMKGIPKIIFVDFDNTLSANKFSEEVEQSAFSQDNYVNWDCICKTNPKTYDLCQPVPCVRNALNFFHKKGSRIILLGWENKHFTRKLKEKWVDHYFDGMFEEKIFTGTAEQKMKVMKVYERTEKIDKQEMVLIEDRPETCDQVNKAGFGVWTLSFVALTFDGGAIPTIL